MSDKLKLKTCPCCKGIAVLTNTVTEAGIDCLICHLKIRRKHAAKEDTGIAEVIAAWNRRDG